MAKKKVEEIKPEVKKMNIKKALQRKLLAAFITIFASTALFTSSTIFGATGEYEYGYIFIYMSVIIGTFLAPFTLVFLIPVSLLVEHMFFTKEKVSSFLFIGSHALLGLTSFIIFQDPGFLLFGVIAATMFGYVDRWLVQITIDRNVVKKILLITTGLYALLTFFFTVIYG